MYQQSLKGGPIHSPMQTLDCTGECISILQLLLLLCIGNLSGASWDLKDNVLNCSFKCKLDSPAVVALSITSLKETFHLATRDGIGNKFYFL